MSAYLLVGVGFLFLIALAGGSFILFVRHYVKWSREKRHAHRVLSDVLLPLGFQFHPLGSGGKWTGEYGNCRIHVLDMAPMPGGVSCTNVTSLPAPGHLRLTVSRIGPDSNSDLESDSQFELDSESTTGENWRRVDRDNAATLFPDAEEILTRLLGPPVILPIAVSADGVQLSLEPDDIRPDQFRQCLEDAAKLPDHLVG